MTVIEEKYIKNTWVHDGREWKLTGRVAIQKSRRGKEKMLWEIQPLSVFESSPTNKTYNRWVQPSVLFMVASEDGPPLVPPTDGTEEEYDNE